MMRGHRSAILVAGFLVSASLAPLAGGDIASHPRRFTQNGNPAPITHGMPACSSEGKQTDTHWLRIFDLDGAHGINGEYCVESLRLAVWEATSASGSQPVTIKTWCWDPALPREYAFFEPRDSARFDQPDTNRVSLVRPVGGCCNAARHDLVVEIVSADCAAGESDCTSFLPGGNLQGQTAEWYAAAEDCGITEPVAIDPGFPQASIIMVVQGVELTPSLGGRVARALPERRPGDRLAGDRAFAAAVLGY